MAELLRLGLIDARIPGLAPGGAPKFVSMMECCAQFSRFAAALSSTCLEFPEFA